MEARMKINGELIRTLREEKAWSQDHLAGASGLSARTIQRVEAEGVASVETRLALAAALGVSAATLMPETSRTTTSVMQPWRVPRWAWLSWATATGIALGVIALGELLTGLALQQMALNLFPWLVLLGVCLVIVSVIGALRRSRLFAPRET